jgi:hypothetical protein
MNHPEIADFVHYYAKDFSNEELGIGPCRPALVMRVHPEIAEHPHYPRTLSLNVFLMPSDHSGGLEQFNAGILHKFFATHLTALSEAAGSSSWHWPSECRHRSEAAE